MTIRTIAVAACATAALGAQALTFGYADWTSLSGATSGNVGTAAAGTIATSFGAVGVTYTGRLQTPTNLGPGGFDYWNSPNVAPTTYNSALVPNRPSTPDILVIFGENAAPLVRHTITFDRPLGIVAMPIVSVGQGGRAVTYAFDTPFEIASQGRGHWGGTATSFTQSGNNLTGREAHGTIVFRNVQSISWTASPLENWHGFTVGTTGEPVPEPLTLALGAAGLAAAVRRRRARR